MCEKINVHKIQGVFKTRGNILDSCPIGQNKEETS